MRGHPPPRPRAWYVWAGVRRAVIAVGDRWLMSCPGCGELGWLPDCCAVSVDADSALTLTPRMTLPDNVGESIGCPRCGWRALIRNGQATDYRALEDRRLLCAVC